MAATSPSDEAKSIYEDKDDALSPTTVAMKIAETEAFEGMSATGVIPRREEVECVRPKKIKTVKILSLIPVKPLKFCVMIDGNRKRTFTNEYVRRKYPQQLIDFYHSLIEYR